jgi:hypothetical protein
MLTMQEIVQFSKATNLLCLLILERKCLLNLFYWTKRDTLIGRIRYDESSVLFFKNIDAILYSLYQELVLCYESTLAMENIYGGGRD